MPRAAAFAFSSSLPLEHREEAERILYLPLRPKVAVLLDDLAGSGQVGPQGDVQALDARALKKLILPGLTLGGHGLVGMILLLAKS